MNVEDGLTQKERKKESEDMKDGELKEIEAKLIFSFGEADESVGIYEGFSFLGIEIGEGSRKRLLNVDQERVLLHGKWTTVYAFDAGASKLIEEMCYYERPEED